MRFVDKFCNVLFRNWQRGDDLDHTDVSKTLLETGLVFKELEIDRGDGRKKHYGDGEQPIDVIRRLGWYPQFCAGNVLKYLRRDKDPEHSAESAKVYFGWLADEADTHGTVAMSVYNQLIEELTPEERARL